MNGPTRSPKPVRRGGAPVGRVWTVLGAALLAVSLAAGPALAQQKRPEEQNDKKQVEQAVRDSIEKVLRAIEGLIDSVPIYEMPEIQDNGDIIIRRKKRTPEEESPEPEPKSDSRST